jgi:hypothetical protein
LLDFFLKVSIGDGKMFLLLYQLLMRVSQPGGHRRKGEE